MSLPTGTKRKESGTARVLGSGTSGIAELLVFHPVDTVSKRLMSNKAKFSVSSLNSVIFREYASQSFGRKFLSLFPGLGYATGYKVLQRIYKFGGQPYANDFLDANFKQSFIELFGAKNGKAMTHATAGSLIGIGEIILLPLDVLKIKRQTNPEAFRSRGFFRVVRDEGFSLYRGWNWTAARNAPGSFALFGGSAFTKDKIFALEDYSQATWLQNMAASTVGSISSIAISQPLDVIKTRIQNANFETNMSGPAIIKDLLKNEGPTAFFKGLVPKILVVSPKLIFSFALAQTLIPLFGKYV